MIPFPEKRICCGYGHTYKLQKRILGKFVPLAAGVPQLPEIQPLVLAVSHGLDQELLAGVVVAIEQEPVPDVGFGAPGLMWGSGIRYRSAVSRAFASSQTGKHRVWGIREAH